MKGKFKGKTSMGFIHGKVYELTSDIKPIYNDGVFVGNCICLYDKYSAAWCPYSGLETVLKNWDFDFENNIIKALVRG